jgi:hypothetical protein
MALALAVTETATLTLTEFLLARIVEDERAARQCSVPKWRYQLWNGEDRLIDTDDGEVLFTHAWMDMELMHIERWHATRVLAECAAKRRIAELHNPDLDRGRLYCSECDGSHTYASWPCATLKLLALPYAEHPDYRPEWRP